MGQYAAFTAIGTFLILNPKKHRRSQRFLVIPVVILLIRIVSL